MAGEKITTSKRNGNPSIRGQKPKQDQVFEQKEEQVTEEVVSEQKEEQVTEKSVPAQKEEQINEIYEVLEKLEKEPEVKEKPKKNVTLPKIPAGADTLRFAIDPKYKDVREAERNGEGEELQYPPRIVPFRAYEGESVGWDFFSQNERTYIPAGKWVTIDTGVIVDLKEGEVMLCVAKSSKARTKGFRPLNCVGIIDPGYHDTIKCDLFNETGQSQIVEKYEKFMQGIVIDAKCQYLDEIDVESLKTSKRGKGGFGSSENQ